MELIRRGEYITRKKKTFVLPPKCTENGDDFDEL